MLGNSVAGKCAVVERPFGFGYNTGYASDANRLHTPNRLPVRRPPMFLDVNSSVLGPASSEFKRCTKCGEWKPRNQFCVMKANKDGLNTVCKPCGAERSRQWRKENPEKEREMYRKYRENNKEAKAVYFHDYYQSHKDEIREKRREGLRRWGQDNKERRREAARRRREADPEKSREYRRRYYEANKDRILERTSAHDKKHPEQVVAKAHRYRARKQQGGGSFKTADLAAIRSAQTDKKGRLICWRCGKPIKGTPHLDHWIPLAGGGTNDAGNLHYMHAHCNLTKSDKHPTEIGRLL